MTDRELFKQALQRILDTPVTFRFVIGFALGYFIASLFL